MAAKGIKPNLAEDDIPEEGWEISVEKWELEAERIADNLELLKQRVPDLEAVRDSCVDWNNRLEKGEASLGDVEVFWDEASPRHPWSELRHGDDPEKNSERFFAHMEEIRESEREAEKTLKRKQKEMDEAFDGLAESLSDERMKTRLPTIVDELRRHNPESLGCQSKELLEECDNVLRNIEKDLERSQKLVENLIRQLLLYALLVSMRRRRYRRNSDRLPAFLVLDNPIGVCNRSDFLDAQLKVAGALGIQCVYLTGINDTESLHLFEHRVAIRKSG